MGQPDAVGNQWAEGGPAFSITQHSPTLDIVAAARYNVPNTSIAQASWLAPSHRGRSQGSQQIPGNPSGYKGSSAHLAGEPVVLRLKNGPIPSAIVRRYQGKSFRMSMVHL